jgi:hypothetical protein
MLAVAFQAHGGQAAVKNWKRSIKVEVENGLRCSIGYWLRRVVDEQQLVELLQQHGKAAHAQRPQNQTLPRRRQQQQQYEAGSEDEQQEQQQEEEVGGQAQQQQQQQQQQQAGFSQQEIRSIQQVSQLQQQRRSSRRPQQLVCVRSKWYGRECFLVTDGSQTTLEQQQQQQQQGAAAAAGDGSQQQQQQQQREYLYTSWRDNTHTWRAVVSLPAAVRRTQLRSSSSSSGTGAIVTIGNLYTSAAAAGTAADLAQLALLGVWIGMRLNFPLETYSAEQQRQRSGAELLQYLQQLRLRVPGFAAAAAATGQNAAAAGVRRSARGLKGTAGDGAALARWHAERAHQRRCGLCTGCLSGRSCVVAAWRRQQQQVGFASASLAGSVGFGCVVVELLWL